MKYNITRKVNLGRFGFNFESVDLGITDCDTKEQAEQEIKDWARSYVKSLLDQEQKLTKKQSEQRNNLQEVTYAEHYERDITA